MVKGSDFPLDTKCIEGGLEILELWIIVKLNKRKKPTKIYLVVLYNKYYFSRFERAL